MPRKRSSRKEWDPRKADPILQERAREAVKETAKLEDFAYRGEIPLGKTWAITFTRSRDAGILEESNFETISEDMEKRFPRDVSRETFDHWAVGWVDNLLVRMLEDDGRVTSAGLAALEWQDAMERYPVADEEDVSRREYEATLENIQNIGGANEVQAPDVYRWLSDNEPEELETRDDGGAWPREEAVKRAMIALGFEEPEEEEVEEGEGEEPEPVLYEHPGQEWFWPAMKPQLEEETL